MSSQEQIVVDGIALSVEEVAVLAFTNSREDNAEGKTATLTTKEAYFWAVLLAHLVRVADQNNLELSEDDFLAGLKYGLQRHIPDLHLSIAQPISNYMNFDNLAFDIQYCFSDYFRLSYSLDSGQERLPYRHMETADRTMKSLISKGLIEDPFFEIVGGIAVAALGFVPISFTQKKKDGEVIYQKVESLWYTYEKKRENSEESVNLCFKVLPVAKKIKGSFVTLIRDLVDNEEP